MIIDVKGTKTEQNDADPAQAYAITEPARYSATPHVLGLIFLGLGLYLKSVFPGFATTRDEAGPSLNQDEEELPPEQLDISPGQQNPVEATAIEWPAPEDWRSILPPSFPANGSEFGRMPVIRLTDISLKPVKIGLESGQFSVAQGLDKLAPAIGAANAASNVAQGSADPDVSSMQAQAKQPSEALFPDSASLTEDPDDRDKSANNRAPRNEGAVYLRDVTGGAVMMIALSDLLAQSSDPDGDPLTLRDLTASFGTLLSNGDGWTFQTTGDFTQEITLSYTVTDGEMSVDQITRFMAIRPAVEGGAEDDLLIGSIWSDDIAGRDGDDNIDGRAGDDVISGGDGDDHILGGDGNDSLHGGDGDDILIGGAGDDHLFGGPGNDRLHGGRGDDVLRGGAGDDVLLDGAGRDLVFGDEGDDHVMAAADGEDDYFEGGDGFDTIDYSQTMLGVRVDLDQGRVTGPESGTDRIVGFEKAIGGAGDDHFTVGDQAAVLVGGDGFNTFEFLPVMLAENPSVIVHHILDFKHGDNVKISDFKLFERLYDRLEDEFEAMYGDDLDEDDIPIRVRHDWIDDIKHTIITADFNSDGYDETNILISGHHALVVTEIVA